MNNIDKVNSTSSREDIITELVKLFAPYAKELLNSGGDFSYMNMFADNFKDTLLKQTNLDEFEVFEILNEACDVSWKSQTE
ncbi:hypothetical protein [Saccharicrinis aurantiacus]|uniref:hypothetical protein n=1 Tax=Saccharicrinis aurantiacus TaxID=1849719 RepID=UPI0008380AC6|nr:hypothetical protein [Saccharicrinis aurantiacus]